MKNWKNLLVLGSAAAMMIAAAGCVSNQGCNKTCDEAFGQDHLQIGWARRSIAKDGPVPITGQFYLRVAQGQYTPVIAQAMAMTNKSDAVIFVYFSVFAEMLCKGIAKVLPICYHE